jgi:uncharacterized protein
MLSNREVVEQMYGALRRRDADTMRALLHPDCVVRTAPGLPFAGGRITRGVDESLRGVWGTISRHFDVLPTLETCLPTLDDTVVGVGTYEGTARATGQSFQAWFVHLWTVSDGRIVGLRQVTDTVQWTNALQPPQATPARSAMDDERGRSR